MDTFSKLGWFFKAHRKRYALGITALVLTSAANLVSPRILGMMADQLDTGKISWQQFFSYVLAILLAALALYVCRYFWQADLRRSGDFGKRTPRPALLAFYADGPDLLSALPYRGLDGPGNQ